MSVNEKDKLSKKDNELNERLEKMNEYQKEYNSNNAKEVRNELIGRVSSKKVEIKNPFKQ